MLRLLLIEDNLPDVELFKITLRHLGLKSKIDLIEAFDGEAALQWLRDQDATALPDLILLDLKLPKVDGKEVLSEIKKDSSLKSIPVIIFSSSDDYEDIRESYELGASCYVRKASDFNQMQMTIQNLTTFWFNSVILPYNTFEIPNRA